MLELLSDRDFSQQLDRRNYSRVESRSSLSVGIILDPKTSRSSLNVGTILKSRLLAWLDLNALLRAAAVVVGLLVPDWCSESALVLTLLWEHFLHSFAPFRCHGSARSLALVAILYGLSAAV